MHILILKNQVLASGVLKARFYGNLFKLKLNNNLVYKQFKHIHGVFVKICNMYIYIYIYKLNKYLYLLIQFLKISFLQRNNTKETGKTN